MKEDRDQPTFMSGNEGHSVVSQERAGEFISQYGAGLASSSARSPTQVPAGERERAAEKRAIGRDRHHDL